MSFGFAVGDFLAVGQLCWKVYKKCKDSPGNYTELSSEVGALHNVIKETEELLSQQGLTTEQRVKLTTCRQGCEDVLKALDVLLGKYESLGTNSRRTFDRMGFGMQDMTGIRLRLISNVTMLDAFNNASSHARLENKLNLLIAEVRAGKREGSVISTQTFDAAAQNNQETWEALRKELEDIGISPGVITEKRQFIIAWFQEAVAAGKLDEDAPSDDNGTDVSLYASKDSTEENDGDVISDRGTSSLMIDPRLMIEPPTTEPNTIRAIVPSGHRPSLQPADVSYPRHPPPSQGKVNSRLRVTYLLNKLRGRDKQFLEAAFKEDVSMIERLLEKGVDIQTRDEAKNTALHLATTYSKEEAVRLLLLKGANIEAKNERGETALHLAACLGHQRLVQILLEEGANIESKDMDGDTAFQRAIKENWNELTIRLLLEKGADIESKSTVGDTALSVAAKYGHGSTVRLLLEKGADIESKDTGGSTALMDAAENGHESTVRLLLEKGADIESKDMQGRTALLRATGNGCESAVRLLLEKGADIESKNVQGSTALLCATGRGNTSTIRLLLEKGADIESADNIGDRALVSAAHNGHESMVPLLLEKGADVKSKDNSGNTALIETAKFGREESTVRLLLEKGAEVNARNALRKTALVYAHKKSVRQLLLNAGARS